MARLRHRLGQRVEQAQQLPSSGQPLEQRLDSDSRAIVLALQIRGDQVVFRLEVRVQRRLDGVRLVDDPLNTDGLNPFLIEQALRGIEKALASAGFSVGLAAT